MNDVLMNILIYSVLSILHNALHIQISHVFISYFFTRWRQLNSMDPPELLGDLMGFDTFSVVLYGEK